MDLTRQNDLLKSFKSWFEGSGAGTGNGATLCLKNIIADNRRRYRMQLTAEDEKRKKRALSALPSTKSRSITDGIADAFIVEYHQDPDSISYTANSVDIPEADQLASWLTKIFEYRASNTFPFYAWHEQSIKAGLVDGIEAAFISWKKESYKELTGNKLHIIDGQQVPPDLHAMAAVIPGVKAEIVDEEIESVVTDSFWIDKLIPGETVFWDPKAPFMNVNLGSFCLVFRDMTLDEINAFKDKGIFDSIGDTDIEEFRKINDDWTTSDKGKVISDPDYLDLGDLNKIRVWIFFDKSNFQWGVQFSLDGKKELSSRKPVNKTFFAGRPVNKLPVVIGYNRSSLHENTGVGIPFVIASHEDEWSRNRNDVQDAATQTLKQRWRVTRGSDVNIDDLINRPSFYADTGEVEQFTANVNIMQAQRSGDQIGQDITELVPTAITNRGRSIVPKGTNAGLGTSQMMDQDSNTKRNNQMKLRNETFMKPVLSLLAELIFAFESDELILKIAGKQAEFAPPMATQGDGKQIIDLAALDFPVNVSINAGMGSLPRAQKAQTLTQNVEWRMSHQVPTDTMQAAQMLNTLTGFDKDQFTPKEGPPPPPPPKVDYKVKTDIPFLVLPQEAQQAIIAMIMSGEASVEANIDDGTSLVNEMKQNGGMGAPPDRTGAEMMDATGPEAMAMSAGGQNGL